MAPDAQSGIRWHGGGAPDARGGIRWHGGFTLVELLVGAVITALIAGATTTALSQMLRARQGAEARREAFASAATAAAMIARDAAECARDSELLFAKVMVADGGQAGRERDSLLMLVRTMRRVRGLENHPEGFDFEVQYRVEEGPAGPVLWRRADPALDAAIDGGGVAAPVAAGVEALSVEASDGENWFAAWDSDRLGMPHGLRIVVAARDRDGRARAVARRVVPLDRVPIPPPAAEGAEGEAP